MNKHCCNLLLVIDVLELRSAQKQIVGIYKTTERVWSIDGPVLVIS